MQSSSFGSVLPIIAAMNRIDYADLVSASTRAWSRFLSSMISVLLQELQQLVLLNQSGSLPLQSKAFISSVPMVLVEITEFVPIVLVRRHLDRSGRP